MLCRNLGSCVPGLWEPLALHRQLQTHTDNSSRQERMAVKGRVPSHATPLDAGTKAYSCLDQRSKLSGRGRER